MSRENRPPHNAALTIAGSDSCGGAGIQADLKTFHDFGVYGASVVTALTAQNTLAVHRAEAVTADMIAAQIEAVLDDLAIGAIKTGMLPDAAAVEAVSDVLERRAANTPLIVDPVLVASSGAALTLENTIQAMTERLFPLATLITPNLAEARALAPQAQADDPAVDQADDPARTAAALLEHGCDAVLLKGGHGDTEVITDWLFTRQGATPFEHACLAGEYHGTGCVLSAAIAAGMAQGHRLENAVATAIDHVQAAIRGSHLPLRGKLRLIT